VARLAPNFPIAEGPDVNEHLLGAGARGDETIPLFVIPERDFSLGAHPVFLVPLHGIQFTF
jgi:hypothetical protein